MQSCMAFLANWFDSGVTQTMWKLPAWVEFSSTLFQASQGLQLMPVCYIHPTTLIQRKIFLSFPFTCLTALKHKFLPCPTCSDQQGPDSNGLQQDLQKQAEQFGSSAFPGCRMWWLGTSKGFCVYVRVFCNPWENQIARACCACPWLPWLMSF